MDKLSLFDSLWGTITDDNGNIRWAKLLMCSVFIGGAWVYGNFESVEAFFARNSVEAYKEKIEQENQLAMETSIPILMNSTRLATESDGLGIWIFNPKEARTMMDLRFYQGRLPEGKEVNDYKSFIVNMTNEVHEAGIKGWPYSYDGSVAEPYSYALDMFLYSCPIYSSDAAYVGQVSFYWLENKSLEEWKRLSEPNFTLCFTLAREVGRYLKVHN